MNNIVDRTGFLMAGCEGLELSRAERDLLKHPAIAGVILFARNYSDRAQLTELTEALHSIKPGFIVSVDQECQSVQRFRDDFTQLPVPIEMGRYYDKDEEAALKLAYAYGVVIGSEMREVNVDLSYMPVLDTAHFGGVIGDRAFHRDHEVVLALGREVVTGLHNGSLPACAKHFPGHGSVAGDTHTDKIVDSRPMSKIEAHDLHPYKTLIKGKFLDAVMLSHIIYDAVSDVPASLSEYWIKTVLREQLGFDGLVCTDDLDMVGSGDTDVAMLKKAMDAGCNLLLVCRRREAQLRELISGFTNAEIKHYSRLGAKHLDVLDTHIHNRIPRGTPHYKKAVDAVEAFNSQSAKEA